MKVRLIFIGIIILIAVAVSIFFFTKRSDKSDSIRTTGIVEGVEVNISSTVPGRILEECCKEGDAVREGAIVIKLESDDLRASVEQALAGVEKAKAEVKVSESAIESSKANIKSSEADIRDAEAEVERARVQMEEAKREMDRQNALFKKEIIPKASLDIAVTNYDTAVANYASSKAKLTATLAKRDAAEAQLNTAVDQLNSAKASLKQSEANLSYAQAKLAETIIRSPISGAVVYKALEKGEMVSPGVTILTIVDLNNLYVRVDIEETLVGSVILNSEATIKIENIPGRIFKGKVSEIGRYGEFATQRDVTRGREDIKTFRVKIALDEPGGFFKPGMTVEVEIPKKT
jgi:multidrug resistance efflux pump